MLGCSQESTIVFCFHLRAHVHFWLWVCVNIQLVARYMLLTKSSPNLMCASIVHMAIYKKEEVKERGS